MRVPDQVLKCVGFIGEVHRQDDTGIYGEHQATGFFVAVPCESPELRGMQFTYFVTAKHVAEKYLESDFCFWVNKKHGGVTTIPNVVGDEGDNWWLHPTDPTADVAVLQVELGPLADIVPVAVQTIGVPKALEAMNIGIGDEVFSTGLFTEVDTTESMIPIVRHGNIAMMPPAKIQTKYGFADVILVEARSLGGLSGSPIFTRNTLIQKVKTEDGSLRPSFSNGHGETLLGLIHGHWDVEESKINSVKIEQNRKYGVNYGIAIVVPAIKIYETLYRKELVHMRKEQEGQGLNSGIPGTDLSDEVTKNADERPFTQADFEASLRKVARRKSDQT